MLFIFVHQSFRKISSLSIVQWYWFMCIDQGEVLQFPNTLLRQKLRKVWCISISNFRVAQEKRGVGVSHGSTGDRIFSRGLSLSKKKSIHGRFHGYCNFKCDLGHPSPPPTPISLKKNSVAHLFSRYLFFSFTSFFLAFMLYFFIDDSSSADPHFYDLKLPPRRLRLRQFNSIL
jgi:hypothetical protein